MPLDNFEWDNEIQEIDEVGPCVVGYARDISDGQIYRIAVALSELEDAANRKVLGNDEKRMH